MTPALLDRPLRGSTLLLLDTETTGFSSKTDGLVEISIVRIDELLVRDRSEPRLLFSSLIDPGVPSPWAGTPIHKLDVRDVVGAPTWIQLWEQVGPILSDPGVVLAGHNCPFDRRFMHSEATPVRPSIEWVDTAKILGRLWPEESAKLDAACERRRIPLDGHRATTDAMATAHLLIRLIHEAYTAAPEERRPPKTPTVGQWIDWQRGIGRKKPAAKAPEGQGVLFGSEPETAGVARAPRARAEHAAPWVVRGGVGGSMYCAAANGVNPFRWVHRPDQARKFDDPEQARQVAEKVAGRAERMAT
jgi:DNA polymerase III epsilon subunit-like protein